MHKGSNSLIIALFERAFTLYLTNKTGLHLIECNSLLTMTKVVLVIFFTSTFLFACYHKKNSYPINEVKEVKLPNILSSPKLEMSGLAWYEENLILLPQLLRTSTGQKKLFSISKKQILHYLSDPTFQISVTELTLIDAEIDKIIPSPEYEAIGFKGESIFLLIESDQGDMKSFIVKGDANENGVFSLDPNSISQVPIKHNYFEMAGETLLIKDEKIYVIYEVNGKNRNSNPQVFVYDLNLKYLGAESFPSIEYRITDATSVNSENKFWLINSFYPSEEYLLKPKADLFSPSVFQSRKLGVKRLIEMEFSDESIQISSRKPIMLHWKDWNWEGLVRLDDLGFLIINDTYALGEKRTYLGFVALNSKSKSKSLKINNNLKLVK